MEQPDKPDLEHLFARALSAYESGDETAVKRLCADNEKYAASITTRLTKLRTLGLVGDSREAPESIGPYRILGRLGEGGMGVVYRAEQQDPVRRVVALKVLKLGYQDGLVLARFELERRALAAMNHSCIARVLDAGAWESGEPYFVMELIDGLPITDYCDHHGLGLEERIRLFQRVCAGVQHAHQKGVMHRDLKPANILVMRDGESHLPKIVDFGLAKATNRELTAQTILTEHRFVLGTPDYMAPEQADPGREAIDARVDIYSLGVILYELLSGDIPFAFRALRRGDPAEWMEVMVAIKNMDPPKPSSKLVGSSADDFDPARRRCATARELSGDLDWITLKALAKEPERRYDSATALAMDLTRYLEHDPVLAGPPSAAYRVRKLARRYRGQLAVALLGGSVLMAGFILFWIQSRRAVGEARVAARVADEIQVQHDELEAQRAEFDQLSAVARAADLPKRSADLVPAWPLHIGALEDWLRDCDELVAALPALEATISDMRARARPPTESEWLADLVTVPRLAQLHALMREVDALHLARAARRGGDPIPIPELTIEQRSLTIMELNVHAWERVSPEPADRAVFGEEALGVAYSRAALDKIGASNSDLRAAVLNTLAWGCLAIGRDAEALDHVRAAVGAAQSSEEARWSQAVSELEAGLAETDSKLERTERALHELQPDRRELHSWRFERESEAFLHDALVETIDRIRALGEDERDSVEARLNWANALAEVAARPDVAAALTEAASAIAAADGVTASELYAGIELVPQPGLVPLGMNPATRLWEFYHLRSAYDPRSEGHPRELVIPELGSDGSITVTDEMGAIFVLLPGGRCTVGGQSRDAALPNYDASVVEPSALIRVELEPFFIAKHELTQGQWMRLSGGDNPSQYAPPFQMPEMDASIKASHPVESVAWTQCDELVADHGLTLPTADQWEYACRAGSETRWCGGPAIESLEGSGNVMDACTNETGWRGPRVAWDDGYILHAPVGSHRANQFGLFDVHGNVWEWTRTRSAGGSWRVVRGGSYRHSGWGSSSAAFGSAATDLRADDTGLRLARPLQR